MATTIWIMLGLLLLTAGVWVVWGLWSGRRELPCPVWLAWMVEMDNPFTRTNRAAVIIGQLEVQPGMRVLDAGCGPGRLTIPLAEAVGESGQVTAVDVQAGMLARMRHKADAAGLRNIREVNAPLTDAGLEQDHYDRAVLVTVLGEIPDRPAALAAIHKALRPGGILAVTEVIFDPHFLPQATVRALAQQAGYAEAACFGHRWAYTLHLGKA